MGPPGAGKGTMSERLEKDFKFLHISAGEILREEVEAQTTVGKEIKSYIEKGDLVPDHVVEAMMKLIVEGKKHYLLDGFPRAVEQAKQITNLKIDAVFFFKVSEDVVVERLCGRREDPKTGKIYHIKFNPAPPRIAKRLIQRKDDRPKVIKERFRVYHEETMPLFNYYKRRGILKVIDATPAPDEVYKQVKKVLRSVKKK